MAVVSFEQATRVYPGSKRRAVDRLDLEVQDGEFLVLVGPSGCGKSTSLRMLAGLEEIDAGAIFIGERNVTNVPPKDRDIAMVFQNYALYPHMTVAENMGFALKIAGVHKVGDRDARSRGRQDARPRELPRPQAGAALRRPAPARRDGPRDRAPAPGVPHGRAAVEPRRQAARVDRTQIASLQRRLGVTTVYVTHDQVEAMTMGDRVAVLKDGVLQQCDTPRGLYDAPVNAFVAGFIGSPAMNLIEGNDRGGRRHRSARRVIPIPRELWERAAQGNGRTATVTVGMRPESLELVPAGQGFPAIVSLVEELGAEAYVYAQMADVRSVGDRARAT